MKYDGLIVPYSLQSLDWPTSTAEFTSTAERQRHSLAVPYRTTILLVAKPARCAVSHLVASLHIIIWSSFSKSSAWKRLELELLTFGTFWVTERRCSFPVALSTSHGFLFPHDVKVWPREVSRLVSLGRAGVGDAPIMRAEANVKKRAKALRNNMVFVLRWDNFQFCC